MWQNGEITVFWLKTSKIHCVTGRSYIDKPRACKLLITRPETLSKFQAVSPGTCFEWQLIRNWLKYSKKFLEDNLSPYQRNCCTSEFVSDSLFHYRRIFVSPAYFCETGCLLTQILSAWFSLAKKVQRKDSNVVCVNVPLVYKFWDHSGVTSFFDFQL